MNPTLKLLLWVMVAAFIGFRFGSGPPERQELAALKEAGERLQYSVNRHEHVENIEGVWVTDAATFCHEWAEAQRDFDYPDYPDYPPYP